jgi:predicted TIM-barrel fold metal-dependent hydrolase
MPDHPIIDISCLPMTIDIRDTVYRANEELRRSFIASGIWDRAFTPEHLIDLLDSAGVQQVLMPAQAAGDWEVGYDVVATLCSRYPDRIRGQAGVDPRSIVEGLRKLETGVKELGFVGAHIYPHWFGLAPDNASFYPFYAKCVELDVPVQIQVGKAWQNRLRTVATPQSIDNIAVDFPELRLVAIHTGYPWERELISLASKHPNLYIGADSLTPYDWPVELVDYITNRSTQPVLAGREKVLFGTNYPALSGCEGFADAVNAVEEVIGDATALEHLLYKNAKRVYRFD